MKLARWEPITTCSTEHVVVQPLLVLAKQRENRRHAADTLPDFSEKLGRGARPEAAEMLSTTL
jgi:hypothetical protein